MRAYFVGFTVGQVLPTSVGGDAARIYETAKRHRGEVAAITGSVLVERALGGVVTFLLAAVGFLLAIGRYPIGAYLWIEFVLVFGAITLGFIFFSHTARERLVVFVPLARSCASSGSRGRSTRASMATEITGTLGVDSIATVVVQIGAVLSIDAAGRAVGIHVSVLAYVVLRTAAFPRHVVTLHDQRTRRA